MEISLRVKVWSQIMNKHLKYHKITGHCVVHFEKKTNKNEEIENYDNHTKYHRHPYDHQI